MEIYKLYSGDHKGVELGYKLGWRHISLPSSCLPRFPCCKSKLYQTEHLCREEVYGTCKSVNKVMQVMPPALALSPARLVLTCLMGKETCATLTPNTLLLEEGPHGPAQPQPTQHQSKRIFGNLACKGPSESPASLVSVLSSHR